MPHSQHGIASARACSRLLLFWSVLAYGYYDEFTTTSTTVRTVEYDFGAPQASAAYQPLGVTPVPQNKQVGLAVGIGSAAAAAAGGIGMAIYAAHEANKPEVITRVVTPAPKVVYVPAVINIDVLSNGQTVNPLPGATPAPPVRLYEDLNQEARRPVDYLLSKAQLNRRDMVIVIFAISLVCCCCISGCVVYGLFCAGTKKKKRGLNARSQISNRLMLPAATDPVRRRDLALEEADTVEHTLAFMPGKPLGLTIDNETGEILEVKPTGQAANQGVREGDQIIYLNGFKYTRDLLSQYEEGENEYEITMTCILDEYRAVEGMQRDVEMPSLGQPVGDQTSSASPLLPQMPPMIAPYAPYSFPHSYGNFPSSMPMSMPTSMSMNYPYVTPVSNARPYAL
jgi:hypothetical protein